MVPALLFTASALRASPHISAGGALLALGRCALYFWLYINTFCLGNQLASVVGDRIDKPDRPLPSGAVSREGARRRWAVLTVAFLVVGWWFGVLPWTVLWVFAATMHNFGGWSRHWFTKNCIAMPLGVAAQLAPAWSFAGPLSPLAWRWLIVIPIVVGVTVSIQDFRDIEGDRAEHRSTLPMVLGEARARALMSLCFLSLPAVAHFALMPPSGSIRGLVWEGVLGLMCLLVAFRLLVRRSPRDDHNTYMLYCYWYCLLLGSGVLLF
jgi:4-hydroxybenzoate polyprenyltransferase